MTTRPAMILLAALTAAAAVACSDTGQAVDTTAAVSASTPTPTSTSTSTAVTSTSTSTTAAPVAAPSCTAGGQEVTPQAQCARDQPPWRPDGTVPTDIEGVWLSADGGSVISLDCYLIPAGRFDGLTRVCPQPAR